jgi:N-methylhydantoinase B
MDAIELSLFVSRIQAICNEMGAVLQYSAFSPNIKDRLDFSCAVFDEDGGLCAQAAHIPVHLGSMAYAMRDLVGRTDWRAGDMLILNDPFLGGTHLPDVTLIAPVFAHGEPCGFVANRAHHADIGAESPGSMPLATRLEDEGLIIPPQKLLQAHRLRAGAFGALLKKLRNPRQGEADLRAQISANQCGANRLTELIQRMGISAFRAARAALNEYAESLALAGLRDLPAGAWEFSDYMEDDGAGQADIPIRARVTVHDGRIGVDFTGTGHQVAGNINCPLSVTAAAVYYCCYCLMPPQTPPCAGSLRPISITAPRGSLVNAMPPAAVAAGNVETSTRIVDVVLGALAQAAPERIPAASQGSMNNIAMGGADWDYYETLGGGMGAGPLGGGLDAVQTHMTNTRNTPIEVVETQYPLRITRYEIRDGSGGAGRFPGGDGLIREYEFLAETQVTLLTERRRHQPWGLQGGNAGQVGCNALNGVSLPAKASLRARRGDRLTIATPGGGGWGKEQDSGLGTEGLSPES